MTDRAALCLTPAVAQVVRPVGVPLSAVGTAVTTKQSLRSIPRNHVVIARCSPVRCGPVATQLVAESLVVRGNVAVADVGDPAVCIQQCLCDASNCKMNGHFSIQNHHFSGTILHYLRIFNRNNSEKVGIYIVICSTNHSRVAYTLRVRRLDDDLCCGCGENPSFRIHHSPFFKMQNSSFVPDDPGRLSFWAASKPSPSSWRTVWSPPQFMTFQYYNRGNHRVNSTSSSPFPFKGQELWENTSTSSRGTT